MRKLAGHHSKLPAGRHWPWPWLSVPAADAADTLHIQAQPLGAALSQLGQQTSLQVFSPEMVAGKQAPAVDGNYRRSKPCASCCKAAAWTIRSTRAR